MTRLRCSRGNRLRTTQCDFHTPLSRESGLQKQSIPRDWETLERELGTAASAAVSAGFGAQGPATRQPGAQNQPSLSSSRLIGCLAFPTW